MRSTTKKAVVGLFAFGLLLAGRSVLAFSASTSGLGEAAETLYGTTGDSGTDLQALVTNIINAILGLMGSVFLVLTVYAGFLWMTAAGDATKIKKAGAIITAAAAGLTITFSAYALSSYVISSVLQSTGTTQTTDFVTESSEQNAEGVKFEASGTTDEGSADLKCVMEKQGQGMTTDEAMSACGL